MSGLAPGATATITSAPPPANADYAVAVAFAVVFAVTTLVAVAAAAFLRHRCAYWRALYDSLIIIASPYVPPLAMVPSSSLSSPLPSAAARRRRLQRRGRAEGGAVDEGEKRAEVDDEEEEAMEQGEVEEEDPSHARLRYHRSRLAAAVIVRREMTRMSAQWQLLAKMHSTVLADRALRWHAMWKWVRWIHRRVVRRAPPPITAASSASRFQSW